MSKPLILVCNDDGVFAPGIKALVSAVEQFGEVVVVAPDSPQSGQGMSITINHPLRYRRIEFKGTSQAYTCDGTPVDCMKLAVNHILKRKPDLVVSGINHGANSSVNVKYSGTMSAALEGCMEKIPSIGFSLLDHSIEANFEPSLPFVQKIVKLVLKRGLPDFTCLNVNIPNISSELIKGIKVCRQANGNWTEELEERTDPMGEKYFWLTGKFKSYDTGMDHDLWALENGYISIVPTHYDMTNHTLISPLSRWEW